MRTFYLIVVLSLTAMACAQPKPTTTERAITNVYDLINRYPGVIVNRHDGLYTIRLRGVVRSRTNAPLILVDGVVVPATSDNSLLSLSVLDVSHVQIIRGSEAVLRFGSRANGGVIVLVTRLDSRAREPPAF